MRQTALLLLSLSCATTTAPPAQPLFDFRNNLWINLHHFLRAAARGMPTPAELTPDERATWDATVTAYKRYAARHVHFDEGMVTIKNTLSAVGNDETPPEIPGEPGLAGLLKSAAPIYRRYWWPAHDALNRSWIAAAQPLVERYGPKIAPRVAAAYGETWPSTPTPVDVTVIGGPVGAYTTSPPTHVIMVSANRNYLGLAGLEMLFHEPSHQWGKRLDVAIAEAAVRHGKQVPPQLWHAVLFYTAGESTRRALAEDGYDGYREYAFENGVYKGLCGDDSCRERVATHWDPHLDGSVSLEKALDDLVAAWPR